MKPLFPPIIFILFLMISIQSNAQEYQPIAKEVAHWIIKKDLISTIEPVDEIWEYFAQGDTSINGLVYKKIYYRNLVTTQDGPPYEADGSYFLDFLIRDDIENKKVYAISFNATLCNPDGESMIYDFSLQLNDTAEFCLLPDEVLGIVDNIEEINIFETNTKSFHILNGYSGEDYIYEGIGSNYGLLEFMFIPLKKDSKYTEMTWLSDYCVGDDCDIFLNTSVRNKSSLLLYPNPASDLIHIEIPILTKDAHILVFDKLGRLIKEFTTNNKQIEINTSSFSKGVYHYQMITDQEIFSGHFIIE